LISLVALLDDHQRVLLLKRPSDVHCGGFWSLPGGKQQHGEDALTCAQRELQEETGVYGLHWRQCHHWQYCYPDRTLHFTLFQATFDGNSLHCESTFQWHHIASLHRPDFPPANHAIMPLGRWLRGAAV